MTLTSIYLVSGSTWSGSLPTPLLPTTGSPFRSAQPGYSWKFPKGWIVRACVWMSVLQSVKTKYAHTTSLSNILFGNWSGEKRESAEPNQNAARSLQVEVFHILEEEVVLSVKPREREELIDGFYRNTGSSAHPPIGVGQSASPPESSRLLVLLRICSRREKRWGVTLGRERRNERKKERKGGGEESGWWGGEGKEGREETAIRLHELRSNKLS